MKFKVNNYYERKELEKNIHIQFYSSYPTCTSSAHTRGTTRARRRSKHTCYLCLDVSDSMEIYDWIGLLPFPDNILSISLDGEKHLISQKESHDIDCLDFL